MADTSVAIKDASGATVNIDAYGISGGDLQQKVRTAPATSVTSTSWTISVTASTTTITADPSRIAVTMTNDSTSALVYIRYDGGTPTSSAYDVKLAPGDYLEVPDKYCTQALGLLGSAAVGNLRYSLGTAA